jgi:hypothetical protein
VHALPCRSSARTLHLPRALPSPLTACARARV